MSYALAILVTVPLALVVGASSSDPTSTKTDVQREVLFKLRDSLQTPTPAGWNNSNYCKWAHSANNHTMQDIFCDSQGRVIEVRLLGQPPGFVLKDGKFMTDLVALTSMKSLTLVGHQLDAAIPPEWSSWRSLKMLVISLSRVEGTVPDTLASLGNLTTLDLSNNKLAGPIPDWLGNLTKLESIDMSNNQWQAGVLPPSLAQLQNLQSISFEGAYLTGGIPSWLRNLTLLTILSLGSNSLKGSVPDWLVDGSMPNLRRLGLNSNQLSGTLPSNLGDILKFVYLQSNYFVGAVPAPPTTITEYIYGMNCFTGSIFADSQQRTPDECTAFLKSQEPQRHARGSNMGPALVAVMTIMGTFVLIVVALLIFYVRKRHGAQAIVFQCPELTNGKVKSFSVPEIRRATDKFTTEIGKGGFATVYRAKLRDGTDVAVKRLAGSRHNDPNAAAEFAAFEHEVALIARLHHRYLVNLIGYCVDHRERMLLFEYVPNGTLSQALFGRDRNPLPWSARMRIAVHVARGIEYLHYGARPPVLHRDIKPGNILLEYDYSAKLADFGLSRETRVCDDGPLTTGTLLKGTLGYTDPEYVKTGKLSEKSDVYSYGIVLLELLTGKRAKTTNPFPGTTHTSLADWCEFYFRNPSLITEMVDRRLNGSFDWDELRIVASIAHDCVYLDSNERPDIKDVVDHLKTVSLSEKARDGELTVAVDEQTVASSTSLTDSHKTGWDTESRAKSHSLLNILAKEDKETKPVYGPRLPTGYSTDYSSTWRELLGPAPPVRDSDDPPPILKEDKQDE